MSETDGTTATSQLLTKNQIVDGAWSLPDLESATLKLKTLLCQGSFLKGYHPSPTREIPHSQVRIHLVDLQRAVCQFAANVGLDPKQLTDDVHAGRS